MRAWQPSAPGVSYSDYTPTAYPRPLADEEGEIPHSPPAAHPPFVFGASMPTPSAPPTQPRCYQTQLHSPPPSAAKAMGPARVKVGAGASIASSPDHARDTPRKRTNKRGHCREHHG
ncbi:hypothetical protein C8R44DRAFT_886845 [Mycena epipterygia]|nr:hypothetical protein C8R44DRAFT_886845 [Mycena epipterygia]